MELLIGQTLLDHLNTKLSTRRTKQERQVRLIVSQLLEALRCLHAIGICHRDIKLENVMVEREPNSKAIKVKLLDFGFATFFETDKTTVKYVIGTPEYMAPEVIDKQLIHGPKADIWSLSVMTYLLLAR